jgi:hypothetical protein
MGGHRCLSSGSNFDTMGVIGLGLMGHGINIYRIYIYICYITRSKKE